MISLRGYGGCGGYGGSLEGNEFRFESDRAPDGTGGEDDSGSEGFLRVAVHRDYLEFITASRFD